MHGSSRARLLFCFSIPNATQLVNGDARAFDHCSSRELSTEQRSWRHRAGEAAAKVKGLHLGWPLPGKGIRLAIEHRS